MNLCSDGHDEVCYEGRKCPACEIINEKDNDIERLENTKDAEIDALEDTINDMREQMTEEANR